MSFSADAVVTGLAVLFGTVGASAGAGKAWQVFGKILTQLGRLVLAICGDGTPEHPGVTNRLTNLEKTVASMETTLAKHVDGDAPTWLAEGQEWGHRLDADVAALDQRVSKLETSKDPLTRGSESDK